MFSMYSIIIRGNRFVHFTRQLMPNRDSTFTPSGDRVATTVFSLIIALPAECVNLLTMFDFACRISRTGLSTRPSESVLVYL